MVIPKNSWPASAERRLKELGIQLPSAPAPFGTYVETVQSGNLLFLSGMLPVNQYTYDAENRISTVSGTAANYVYDAAGERVRKNAGSTSTEYIRFNGNVIAEYNPATGDWSDYIFAGGRRIARALALDNGLRVYGTRCGSCGNQYTLFYLQNAAGLANYTIASGDKLNMTQYQTTGSRGGIVFVFTDGTNSNWNVKDQDGYFMNDDGTQGSAHVRHLDLSPYAGKTIQSVLFNQETDTAPGAFAIVYEQVALSSADATVRPIYTGESSSPVSSIVPTSGITGAGSQIDVNRNKAIYPTSETTYYHSNQVGSSTLITAGNGWPVWQATFLPYGEEYNAVLSDGDHYKFSGKERDAETGLDYFGARYYSNGLGRFNKIDPDNEGAIPEEPQSWNGYAYVGNEPVTNTDPDGRDYHLYGIDDAFEGDISDEAFNRWCSQVQCTVSASGAIYDANGSLLGREVWFDNKRADRLNNMVGFMNWFMLNQSLQILSAGTEGFLANVGSNTFLRLGIQSGRVATAVKGAAQLTKFTGTLDRIIQTSNGPIRVFAQVTEEGDTAVVSDVAIYPAESEQAIDVGFTEMRQGLREIQNELKESGYSAMRVDKAYRTGGMGAGRTTTFTVKLR